jgi:regulator of sirC expression with transglutaminase-like and TPR domain
MRKIAGLLAASSALLAGIVFSFSTQAQRLDLDLRGLRAIFEKPEAEIDLARTKLVVDKLIDPDVDIEATLSQLDAMARAVRASAGPQATPTKTAQVLRAYLHDAGDWNDHRPFKYDLEADPYGRTLAGAMLARYLATRKGNCVSMPTLFVVLAQKLGLNATFAMSPQHFFVKFRDESGRWHNLETTTGGYPRRDALYQLDTPMTPSALKNGLYMRALSRKEAIVETMLSLLIRRYSDEGKPEKVMAVADLALEFQPASVTAMLAKGQGYFLLLQRDFAQKYPAPKDIPAAEVSRFRELQRNNRLWFEKAEALGWREPDPEADARYLQMVKNLGSS